MLRLFPVLSVVLAAVACTSGNLSTPELPTEPGDPGELPAQCIVLGETCHLLNPFSSEPLPRGVVLFEPVPAGFVGTLHGFEFGQPRPATPCPAGSVEDPDGSKIASTPLAFSVVNPLPGVRFGHTSGTLCNGEATEAHQAFTWNGMAVQITRIAGSEVILPPSETRAPGESGYYLALVNGLNALVGDRSIVMRDDISTWIIEGNIPGAPGPDMDDLLAIAALLRAK